ncbi:MAG TPA: hypothetical protein VKB87_04205 [Myxococcaceae bacterium]|nr:hypothetical protein [Myxococcaceae bacterium]
MTNLRCRDRHEAKSASNLESDPCLRKSHLIATPASRTPNFTLSGLLRSFFATPNVQLFYRVSASGFTPSLKASPRGLYVDILLLDTEHDFLSRGGPKAQSASGLQSELATDICRYDDLAFRA